jgi:hypothetical protein
MKIATFRSYIGSSEKTVNAPVHHERLTFDAFKKAYGGAPITDIKAEKIIYVPDGFSVWKTDHGLLMAIRDE